MKHRCVNPCSSVFHPWLSDIFDITHRSDYIEFDPARSGLASEYWWLAMADHTLPQTVDELSALLVRSKLATADEVASLQETFRLDHLKGLMSPNPLKAYCTLLVDVVALTRWQCEKLRSGKWKGFYLDDYELIAWIGRDTAWSYFEARRSRVGGTVKLAVAPDPASPSGLTYRLA